MLKANDIIIYNNEKYHVLYVYESGYCEIKKLNNDKYIELIHRSELKQASDIQ
ncbi:hypothetical protein NCCP133_30960 [Cytobacillus sp. NCCP-133]|nr:hypothetical protein NCCP133_30960 [Cytobacillus sp. NCCP-133]